MAAYAIHTYSEQTHPFEASIMPSPESRATVEQERLHVWAVTIRVEGGGKSITSNDRSPLMQ